MPCTYIESQSEINARNAKASATRKKMKADLDLLTHENDMLRELAIALLDEHRNELGTAYPISRELENTLRINQEQHRKEDLKRLKKTFIETKNAEKLGLVILADPTKPLEPQLGFDPDDY